MYYILYLSTGTNWFSEDDLTGLLSVSVKNNTNNKVTGILLYHQGNFIQLLEGGEQSIRNTFNRISADNRHKDITIIANGQLQQRNFPEWAMGFKSINAESLKQLKGYFQPAIQSFENNQDNNFSLSLLNAFLRAAQLV
jgi:hypothetical protein